MNRLSGLAAFCAGVGFVGCLLVAGSVSYPHAWMPLALCAAAISFYIGAKWLSTIAFRLFSALALCVNVTGLWMLSSVTRMNQFQAERPTWLLVCVGIGLLLTLAALLAALIAPRQHRKPGVYLFIALLMVSFIAYGSSSAGGPSPMEAFFRHVFGMSASSAEEATIIVRKCLHFTFYGALGLMGYLAAVNSKIERRTAIKLGIIIALTVACFDEIRQTTTDNRTGSPVDVLLDVVGATTFCVVAAATKRVRSR